MIGIDWLFGIMGFSLVWILLYFFLSTHFTFISITLYLHRSLAHRALDLHPVLCHFFRFVLWLSTGMVTQEWVAVHRKHHAYTETEEDPHSPVIHGLPNILFNGVEYYRRAAVDKETIETFGSGCPNDWIERNVYAKLTVLGVALLAVIDLVLFGVVGIVIWALQMMWTPFWAAGVVNGVGHALGYRNFECADNAKNIFPVGLLACGEELHNNHHTYPNSARFSVKNWEFDLGWQYIRLLAMLKLAKPLHTGPVVERVDDKASIDVNTLWAAVNDRFRIMAEFAERVMKPNVRAERKRADCYQIKATFRRAKRALCAHETILKDRDRTKIVKVTQASPLIQRLYVLKLRLNELWRKRNGSTEELLQEFKEWCTDAETSNVRELKDFVADLKTLTVPQPRYSHSV